MKNLFTDYLFAKHLLVSSKGKKECPFETIFSLANLFNIRIVSGQSLAEPRMINVAKRCIGSDVPKSFYQGFPRSVRELSADKRLFDQLLHYFMVSIFGGSAGAGASVFEEDFERLAFREKTEIKEFSIITEAEAVRQLTKYVNDLLASTRPLSESQYQLVLAYIREYRYEIPHCASKDTAVRLLLDTQDPSYAAFLQLSDVIRILDHLNYEKYGNKNLKKLNLKNQDRKFLIRIINTIFRKGQCNIADCFEKKRIWNGLLHHIHYQPINPAAEAFVAAIRGKENLSVYSAFEKHMQQGNIQAAVRALIRGKGSGALLRKLTYILSRCDTEADVVFVLQNLQSDNPLVLIQLILEYMAEKPADQPRIFKFTKHNLLCIHEETEEEAAQRRSWVSDSVREKVLPLLWENLEKQFQGKLGKVYIAPDMEKVALPLQETASSSGFGVLPKGSRIPIKVGKKIRCFTYWEKVDDIDLSVIGMTKDFHQYEFSWRNMWYEEPEEIVFSGDQTSGYDGGSEYFDIDLDPFMTAYPDVQYLIFCNNVYSKVPFSECDCKAGYMDRDILDSGEVFEPKTVETSFAINGNSTFAHLFAIDLEARELVWLNIGQNSEAQVAGDTSLKYLVDYFHITQVINLRRFFSILATEIVEDPKEADVIVSDESIPVKEGAEIIRSYSIERIQALMNGS